MGGARRPSEARFAQTKRRAALRIIARRSAYPVHGSGLPVVGDRKEKGENMRTAIISIGMLAIRQRVLGEPDTLTMTLFILVWLGLFASIILDVKELFGGGK